jgi:hypothetical protein
MKVFIVGWATASQDDNGNCSAYGNVHDVYTNYIDAKKGLVELKDEFYNEIVNNPDFDEEEVADRKASTQVYGSVEDHYFEIDYESWDIPNEVRIYLEEKEIIEG